MVNTCIIFGTFSPDFPTHTLVVALQFFSVLFVKRTKRNVAPTEESMVLTDIFVDS